MSTAKSSDDGTKKPPKSSSEKGTGKKSKSKGFIESSDFKPSWLETGPLPADVLPPMPDPADSETVAEELAALQEALRRYYGSEAPAEVESEPVAATDVEPESLAQLTVEAAPEPAPPPAPIESETPPPEGYTAAEPAAPPPDADIDALLAELEREDMELDLQALPPVDDAIAALWEEEEPQTFDLPPTAIVEAEEARLATGEVDFEPVVAEMETRAGDAGDWDGPAAPPAFVFAPEAALEPEPMPAEVGAPQAPPTAELGPASASIPRAARPIRRRSRLSRALLAISLVLLAAAAIIYFVNPFTRLAMWLGSLARPVSSPAIAPPSAADTGGWCAQGDFAAGDPLPRLRDDGTEGDLLAGDAVFALDFTIPEPGSYRWQVVSCDDPTRAFPAASAWIVTDQPDQPVTFVFDSNERADRLFFPIPYAVSALDSAQDYHVVGSFQDWIVDDASGRLEPLSSGLYQQVRRIARSGNYESYVIVGDMSHAIDAYGRTTEPIPFSFDTDRNGDYVVFLVDIDRGRASVMYDMPPLLTRLAFGGGHLVLSITLAGLAGLLLLGLLLRELMLRNDSLWMESGCPRCHEQELMRISRRPKDRMLHMMGIPAYRYRCRNCTWEGTRLSEAGRSVSPGATIARIEHMR